MTYLIEECIIICDENTPVTACYDEDLAVGSESRQDRMRLRSRSKKPHSFERGFELFANGGPA